MSSSYHGTPASSQIIALEQRIAALEKLHCWPSEDERYLHGDKPDPCLYRQMPEEFLDDQSVFMHGDHLTRENLRGKWEIAAELAYRDRQITTLRSRLAEAEAREEQLITVLRGAGFVPCDIPACNCSSWHQVEGYKRRFDEINEATEDYYRNGETLLQRVKRLVSLLSERDELLEMLKTAQRQGIYWSYGQDREHIAFNERFDALSKARGDTETEGGG